MNLKHAAVAVVLSLSLAPVAARADQGWNTNPGTQTDWTQGWNTDRRDFWEGDRRDHRHDEHCRVEHRGGRYQLQSVQRWVEGRYEQYWVPAQCQTVAKERHGRGHGWGRGHTRTVCTEGHYASHYVPAHYQTVQEWVWVPSSPRFGVHVSIPVGR